MESNYINKIINILKSNINKNFDIKKIDINTNSEYYNVNVIIFKNKQNMPKNINQDFFIEIILDKVDYNIIHCFTNCNSKNIQNEDINYSKSEKYTYQNILKIFYDNKKSSFICSNNRYEEIINKNDIYEIINKDFYYTYIINIDGKLKFISKGIRNTINQDNNKDILNIIFDNNNYEIHLKSYVSDRICKQNLNCINPDCKYNHTGNYDITKAYNEYILNEKEKKPNFKSIRCKNDDDKCIKHKYNKCIFLHKNDPINTF